ncbi:MAG: HAD-IIIA family hydrolase [Brevinematales bacterium]|nr:HAD-IIIA family hydrolase [Brevinematales bacterium]
MDCILKFPLKKGLDYSNLFFQLKEWLNTFKINRIFLLSEEIEVSPFINIKNFSQIPKDISDDIILIEKFFDFDVNYLISFHKAKGSNVTIPLRIDYEAGNYLFDDDFRIFLNSNGEGFNPIGCYILNRDMINKIGNLISHDKGTYGFPVASEVLDFENIHYQLEIDHIVNHISDIRNRKKIKVVFLDRDGIINEDFGYVYKIEDLKFKDGIFDFMFSLQKHFDGFIITTNQAGIAKGKFTEDDYLNFQDHLERKLINKGLKILGSFYCSFHEDGIIENYKKKSLDRKPEPGMFLKAAQRFNIDLTQSIMVGDKDSDRIKLPYLRSYILKGNYEVKNNNNVYGSFEEILNVILNEKVF